MPGNSSNRSPYRLVVEVSLTLTIALLMLAMLVRSRTGIVLSQGPVQPWSIGYWTPWGSPPLPLSDIEWGALTHVVQYAALVQPDGTLDLNNANVAANAKDLIAAAHASGVKVLLGICQPFGQATNGYMHQALNGNRATLVQSISTAVNTYGFDGIDLDWEPFDIHLSGPLMQAFASDLRAQLGTKIMTAAAVATTFRFWGSVQAPFDRVNVMTYDLSGTWDPYSWHNAALFDTDGQVWSVNLAVSRFVANGVPAGKLGIGIPLFGWRWSGGQLLNFPGKGITGPRQNWVASWPPSRTQIHYQLIAPLISPDRYRWDSVAKAPYLSIDNPNAGAYAFITYDDEQSIAEKINYVRTNNLGGWIIWDLAGDYFPDQNTKHPLLTAIRTAMEPVSNATTAP